MIPTAKKGGNPQNLKPFSSVEEARKKGRAGGIASARARQERKSMRETAEILLKMPMKNGPIDSLAGVESLQAVLSKDNPVNLTLQDMMLIGQIRKATKGDTHAFEVIMDLVGEQSAPTVVSPLDKLAEEIKRFKEDEDGDR